MLIEQHSKFFSHTLQVLYMCTICDSTNINTIIEFVPNSDLHTKRSLTQSDIQRNSLERTRLSLELFHQPTLMHNFLYSLTICLLHYYPRHVSSISMSIFRRKNCIHTASGILALCKRLPTTLVESGLSKKRISIIMLMFVESQRVHI